MLKKTKIIWGILLMLGGFLLGADDTEASRLYQKGLDQIKAKEYYDALKTFKEAEVMAKSNTIRANSIRAQIGAAKLAGKNKSGGLSAGKIDSAMKTRQKAETSEGTVGVAGAVAVNVLGS